MSPNLHFLRCRSKKKCGKGIFIKRRTYWEESAGLLCGHVYARLRATSVIWRCSLSQVAVHAHCVVEEKLSWTFMPWMYVCTSVNSSAHVCTLIFHVKTVKGPCTSLLDLYHWRLCMMVSHISMEYFKINKNLSDILRKFQTKIVRGSEKIFGLFQNKDPGYIQIGDYLTKGVNN